MSVQENSTSENRSVTVVVAICDDTQHLEAILRSCMDQTVPPAGVLLVPHDAARDEARRFAASHSNIAVVLAPECDDHSTVRQKSLSRVSTDFVVFVNANERLTPKGIEAGLRCFADNPEAWLVYGAHRLIDATGRSASPEWQEQISPSHWLAAVSAGGAIAVEAAAMYRTDGLRLVTEGGQNGPTADVYSSTERSIVNHPCCVAEYHGKTRSMVRKRAIYRLKNEDRSRQLAMEKCPPRQLLFHDNAPQVFAVAARELVQNGWNWQIARTAFDAMRIAPITPMKIAISRATRGFIHLFPRWIGGFFGEALWRPNPGMVRFGDFNRTVPISAVEGFDRGKPIDRYYIERVLADHSELIRGRVLEVTGSHYTRMFGRERVVCSEVLDIDPLNQAATVIGDLGAADALPEEAFDCIILTQTLQLIYNLDNAIVNLYRALAPGGSLLVTVPGISPIDKKESKSWCWTFTERSLKAMLAERFGKNNVDVRSDGNVFAAICFLTGLALAEVGTERLESKDDRYPVMVFAHARKSDGIS